MKINLNTVSIGADPEIFFRKNQSKLGYSCEGLLGGTKDNPRQMANMAPDFCIQEDGVAAEFNIPAAHSPASFAEYIFAGLNYVKSVASAMNFKVSIQPVMFFPEEQLQTESCSRLGCDPDYNVWTMEQNPTPVPPKDFRTAAGHIHIGWPAPSLRDIVFVGKMAEIYITLPSIVHTNYSIRRQLYGKSGACRFKPYGIEIRSPDNFWLRSRRLTQEVGRRVYNIFNDGNREHARLEYVINEFSEEIQNAINTHDKVAAKYLCHKFGVPLFNH